MASAANGLVLEVTASDGKAMDLALDSAVAKIREQAMVGGQRGILVTRYTPGFFTVALSDEVPYGSTFEQDLSEAVK